MENEIRILLWFIGINLVLLVGVSILFVRRLGANRRAKVTRGVLHFTLPDGSGGTLRAADMEAVVDISSKHRGQAIEIVMHDGRRIILNARPAPYGFRVLLQKLRLANHAIRTEVGKDKCHACKADLHLPTDQCPQCGAAVSTPSGTLW